MKKKWAQAHILISTPVPSKKNGRNRNKLLIIYAKSAIRNVNGQEYQ